MGTLSIFFGLQTHDEEANFTKLASTDIGSATPLSEKEGKIKCIIRKYTGCFVMYSGITIIYDR
jgi:hypothetical protein